MIFSEYNLEFHLNAMKKAAEEKGREEGTRFGKAAAVIELLEDLGAVPDELCDKIRKQTDLNVLRDWLKLAKAAESIEAFEKSIGDEV